MLNDVGMAQCQKPQKLDVGMAVHKQQSTRMSIYNFHAHYGTV